MNKLICIPLLCLPMFAQNPCPPSGCSPGVVVNPYPFGPIPSFNETNYTYWVDQVNGLDTNNGTTINTPFKTISKVNALTLTPGQSVGFKRGDTWFEMLTVAQSGTPAQPITFGAYGSGAAPIISSSTILNSFANVSGNVWSIAQASDPKEVIRSGIPGAKESSQGALVAQGEWFWDGSATLYLYTVGNPNDGGTEIAGRNASVQANGQNYLTFRSLDIRGVPANVANMFIFNIGAPMYGITIEANSFPYSGFRALYLYNCTNCLVENNSLNWTWNGLPYPSGAGYGILLFSDGAGFANNTVVRYNYLQNQFIGVYVTANASAGNYNTLIHHNLIVNSMVNSIDLDPNTAPNNPVGIYHNTIFHNPLFGSGHAISVQTTGSAGSNVRNNLIVNAFTGTNTNVEGLTFQFNDANEYSDFNLIYQTPGTTAAIGQLAGTQYSTLGTWQAALSASLIGGADAHSLSVNPNLNGDYSLPLGSSATGAGQYIAGVSASTSPNIGAYDPPASLSGQIAQTCEVHIWGSGTGSVLQNTDGEVASCLNTSLAPRTITGVSCWANAGSPTVTPILTGGGSTSVLAATLTCGTAIFAPGTINGSPTISPGGSIDANITIAGGVATNIRMVFTMR